jgi:hypothetical protein
VFDGDGQEAEDEHPGVGPWAVTSASKRMVTAKVMPMKTSTRAEGAGPVGAMP